MAGGTELPNREVIGRLLEAAGRDWSLVLTVPDRPGHDRRYAMDGAKTAALGWRPQVPFERGLPETVAWYRDHPDWVASAPERGLGQLLRAPVRREARGGSSGRRERADRAGRGHGLNGPAGPGAGRGARGRAVHGAAWARSPGPARSSTSTPSRGAGVRALIERDRPELVIHAAAWTDVDGCAREPASPCAGTARPTGADRRGLREPGSTLAIVSTNEVFDGERTDGRGYGRSTRRTRSTPTAPASCSGEQLAKAFAWPTRGARDRPDGLAPRPARQRLPREDRPRRPAARDAGTAAQGGGRRDRHARRGPRTSPTRSSS